MDTAKQLISTAVASSMRERGYRKKALTWQNGDEASIRILNFQKSAWGNQFYINLGVYLRCLGKESWPPFYHAQIQSRLKVPNGVADLEALLNFDSDLSPTSRTEQIVGLVRDYALPWLDTWSSRSYIEATLRKGARLPPATGCDVYEHFGFPVPE